jgi:hypothetical protein
MRGLTRVQQQCLLAATAQNIKKIALLLSRIGPDMPTSTLPPLLSTYIALLLTHRQLATHHNRIHRNPNLKTNPTKYDGVRQQSEATHSGGLFACQKM